MPANLTPVSSAAEVAGNIAFVCMYVQVWGNGCTHYRFTQHWVNLKATAEECKQNKQTSDKTVCRSCIDSTCLSLTSICLMLVFGGLQC